MLGQARCSNMIGLLTGLIALLTTLRQAVFATIFHQVDIVDINEVADLITCFQIFHPQPALDDAADHLQLCIDVEHDHVTGDHPICRRSHSAPAPLQRTAMQTHRCEVMDVYRFLRLPYRRVTEKPGSAMHASYTHLHPLDDAEFDDHRRLTIKEETGRRSSSPNFARVQVDGSLRSDANLPRHVTVSTKAAGVEGPHPLEGKDTGGTVVVQLKGQGAEGPSSVAEERPVDPRSLCSQKEIRIQQFCILAHLLVGWTACPER
mmetsp:Transcript_3926/g.9668  ORF Transcript_3926/g.9668 Transcript_3926/m.9668 type:complete len:262 (+) Transcript_3926:33-818(+)